MSEYVMLSSGRELPSVGFGFWKIDRGAAADTTTAAIRAGYRHLDCACDYGNESEVGDGIKNAIASCEVSRDDLWVTSKLWNTYHRQEHVRPALLRTLADLKLDYLDLYLIHFPISLQYVAPEKRYPPEWFFDPDVTNPHMQLDAVPILETWAAMCDLVAEGLVKEIGVCNFGASLLRDLMASSETKPAVLQVEMHPRLTQEKLLRFCHESQIAVTAFSPLGAESYFSLNMAESGESLLTNPAIVNIAKEVNRTAAQVILRWGVQRGTAVVPKTTRSERMQENRQLFDFELTTDQMRLVSSLNQNRRFNDPGDFAESAFNTFCPIYE